jgi:hypothetical protein
MNAGGVVRVLKLPLLPAGWRPDHPQSCGALGAAPFETVKCSMIAPIGARVENELRPSGPRAPAL